MNIYRILYYKVKWGDTLKNIADSFNLDVPTIKHFNRIEDTYVGQIIKIPTNEVFNNHKKAAYNLKRDLKYYLVRHANKRRYYKFTM